MQSYHLHPKLKLEKHGSGPHRTYTLSPAGSPSTKGSARSSQSEPVLDRLLEAASGDRVERQRLIQEHYRGCTAEASAVQVSAEFRRVRR